ncbi:pyrimidine-nucleoside phosphorylase [Peptococcaceae bacterium]|nr:pyrimidine-nucleoside phosphorylase [Peptococcaceae bacterium]
MQMYDLIKKKRDGGEHSTEEINYIIENYTSGIIPDYQVSAWLMAICFNGLSLKETVDLTMAMARSGDMLDLGEIPGIKVDKHSTGGVGDKTTLVLAPLVAAAGVPIVKMSGRGLGHTGGTIDKLESIPGFNPYLEKHEFIKQVKEINIAIIAQTAELAPADKKLYALRDATATVDNIPLISSSIMSKKIASGADAIVLDVKTGRGAFMQNLKDAYELARTMVEIGKQVGRRTVALITDMNQPLGFAVGNALEVIEALETLKGNGPNDLRALCLELGAHIVEQAGVVKNTEEGKALLKKLIDDGSAIYKFEDFVRAQNGSTSFIENYDELPQTKIKEPVLSESSGYVHSILADEVGKAAMQLGAGRSKKKDDIDHAAGIMLGKKSGDMVEKGEVLAVLYANDREKIELAKKRLIFSFEIKPEKPVEERFKLIYNVIDR